MIVQKIPFEKACNKYVTLKVTQGHRITSHALFDLCPYSANELQ